MWWHRPPSEQGKRAGTATHLAAGGGSGAPWTSRARVCSMGQAAARDTQKVHTLHIFGPPSSIQAGTFSQWLPAAFGRK